MAHNTDVRHRSWVSPTNTWGMEVCSQLQEGGALVFRCRLHVCQKVAHPACGALLDDLLLVTGIAPSSFKQTYVHNPDTGCSRPMRVHRPLEHAPRKGPPSCGVPCTASLKKEANTCDLTGGPTPPPPAFISTHSSAPALITPASWTEFFAHRFRKGNHINVLELVALVSLLRRLSNQGVQRQRILCCMDSRVVLGAVSRGRSSSRKLVAEACLRVPRLLAHRRPAVGPVVGQTGGRAFAALLFGLLAL